jgi:hypothetical protein
MHPLPKKTYFEMSKYSGKSMDVNPDILCLHTKFHAKSDIFCVLCKKDNFWCQNSYSQNVFSIKYCVKIHNIWMYTQEYFHDFLHFEIHLKCIFFIMGTSRPMSKNTMSN